MQTYNYNVVDSVADLIDEETREKILQAHSVLIQVFSGEEKTKIQNTLQELGKLFPTACIITSSTDGEIYEKNILTKSTVVSISTFEETYLKIAFSDAKDSFAAGKNIAKEIITQDTKLIITFANGLLCNGDDFLDGISSENSNILVSGGLSGDNAEFKKCYVGINTSLHDVGAVGVSLNSKRLQVQNLHKFGWRPIGSSHIITKSEKNRVYTIDNIPAVDFYIKYLGIDVAKRLPDVGIEFPLLFKNNDFFKARAITGRHEDGSLSFAGNIKEGEEICFGIGDSNSILSEEVKHIENMYVETFFIYSCMARRRFMPKLIYTEIVPFAFIAPTSGFFTYGEFYTLAKPELLNQTLTAVALSESKEITKKKTFEQKNSLPINPTINALTHLINVSSQELYKQKKIYKEKEKELNTKIRTLEAVQKMSKLSSWDLDLKTKKITWCDSSYELYKRDPLLGPPSYEEFINMVLPEDRKALIHIQEKLYDGEIHSIEIHTKRGDGKILTVLESAQLLSSVAGEPLKIVGITLDLTELREKDSLLIQQSKAAQMGEMINMIAHQWRQPLNAVSATCIKINMLNEMGNLTEDEITKSTQYVENMTQKMSKIINDFMEFNKPTNKKEYIRIDELLDDMLNLIGVQLKNHNISVDISIETEQKIFTYKRELGHILINLLANARDALEQSNQTDKKISIRVYTKVDICVIKIGDTGGGVPEEFISRIFQPYFTTKGSNKGTGLGLYMSKKLLKEQLDGDIFVRNRDKGAEFTIILDLNNE